MQRLIRWLKQGERQNLPVEVSFADKVQANLVQSAIPYEFEQMPLGTVYRARTTNYLRRVGKWLNQHSEWLGVIGEVGKSTSMDINDVTSYYSNRSYPLDPNVYSHSTIDGVNVLVISNAALIDSNATKNINRSLKPGAVITLEGDEESQQRVLDELVENGFILIEYFQSNEGSIQYIVLVKPDRVEAPGIEITPNFEQQLNLVGQEMQLVFEEINSLQGVDLGDRNEIVAVNGNEIRYYQSGIEFRASIAPILLNNRETYVPVIHNIAIPQRVRYVPGNTNNRGLGTKVVQVWEKGLSNLGYKTFGIENPSNVGMKFWDKQGYKPSNDPYMHELWFKTLNES